MTNLAIPPSALDQAVATLLVPNELDLSKLSQTLASIHTHQIDFADLYFQHISAETWSLEEGQVKAGSFDIEAGVGVRAVSGEKSAFAYSDDISLNALAQAAEATRAIGQLGQSQTAALVARRAERQLYSSVNPLQSLTDADKVTLLEKLERYARAHDSRVSEVMASLSAEYELVLVVRSDGLIAADIRPMTRISLQVIAQTNGRREQGYGGGGGRVDYLYFTDAVLQDYAQKAVDQALINLDSRPTPAGVMTIVLGSGWPGVLLHEAVGHGLEGDFNRKGTSAFSGRIGERVASPGVTVVDDGTLTGRRGSLNIDDEGNPSQRTVLIEDGILRGYMQDTLNARLLSVPITGNARRESFAHLPMPRMTNTLMENGDRDPQEIISSVEDGIYAVSFGGGQVDITSGKFVFSMVEAYKIEKGKLTYPVKGATLIGNGPDALTRVSMIGNNLALDPGFGLCGKEGQMIPVGVGQPTLRIEAITVGGTA